MTFQINPLNRDLIDLKNETAISRSIRNLVLTSPGERFFNSSLGSYVGKALFENVDPSTAATIKSEIESTISLYEPRVRLNNVIVQSDNDNSEFNVTIIYTIVGIDASPQQLTFVLQPTR